MRFNGRRLGMSLFSNFRKKRVCLCSMAIGEIYKERYNSIFRLSHENYCKKVGYDYRLIEDFIDPSASVRSLISLQKILICELEWAKNYEIIIFIDADIIISCSTPPIDMEMDGSGRIGIVDEYAQPTREGRLWIQKKLGWEASAKDYYALSGFDIETNMIFNSGLIVMYPNLHRYQLASIYWAGRDTATNHHRGFHYEQSLIGYHLQITGNYQVLPSVWNAIWAMQKMSENNKIDLMEFADRNYFIHFAGPTDIDRAVEISGNERPK